MREILFKAKRMDNGEWVEGFYLKYIKPINGEIEHRIFVSDPDGVTWYAVYENTICQYTGLTDKNGCKIWENDVVEVWWKQRTLEEDFEPQRYKAIIEYGNPNGLYSWGWQLRFLEDFPHNPDILLWIDMEECGAYCEVIGSIFDNPELLKAGEA